MSIAELRANKLYNEYHLKNESPDVKRMLMILLLSDSTEQKHPVSYEEAFNMLPGAWEHDGLLAEEEIDAIYKARVNGETRKISNL